MTRRAWAELVGLSAIWGSSYLFISLTLRGFGPFALVFLRVGLAAAVLAPVLIRKRAALAGRWHLVPLVALPQVAVPFVLISAGEQRIDSGLAGILVATMPLWLVVLMPLLGLGRPALRAVLGTLTGLVGVVLLLGGIGHGPAPDLLGAGMIVAAAVCYAIGVAAAKRFMTGVDPVVVTASTMTTAAVVTAPFAVFEVPGRLPSASVLGALLALALVCTAGAFVLFYRLIAEAGPQRAGLVAYLAPLFAVTYGAVLLGEPIGAGTFAGLALILFGSWLATRRARPARTVAVSVEADPPLGNTERSPARPIS
ncbi:DMT family transporter [Flindersiella endophytica]